MFLDSLKKRKTDVGSPLWTSFYTGRRKKNRGGPERFSCFSGPGNTKPLAVILGSGKKALAMVLK
jgi:hypothetical protein